MDIPKENFELLFETSWEVCNKIGGIYTVLSTKAQTLQRAFKDRVIFVGPDVWTEDNPSPYFKETPSLLKQWRSKAQLPEGVSVRVGRWDIPGRPVVVLVKFDGMYAMKDEFYGNMWEQYGVDSLHAYGDYDEGCAFAHAAGVVIESICRHNGLDSKNYIAHFDEWTTGMGLLYLKWRLPQVATIFTTHATSIGRSICGNNKPLYGYLSGYDGDQMARELNMEAKHSLEKAAALQADCFTTVSRITAIECGQLLGRQPDVVTPNGFEQNFVPATKTKLALAREAARRRILDVVSALTGQDMDDDTFIVATSGRNEYRNKGIDLFLDAVNRLGEIDPQRRVLALILVPAWVKEARADLKEAMSAPYRNALNEPIITHWLNNQDSDSIICRIRSLGFENGSASRVMAVYVPCYLNGGDGVVDMSYYDVIPGLDATVFPSYYEPWGYTPLESVAFGVPTVTTTLSGFGQWILSQYENGFESCGVMVIDRGDFNYDQVKEDIAVSLRGLTEEGAKALSGIQRAAMSTAKDASWTNFIKYYYESFDVALGNAAKRMPKNAAAKKRNQRKQK
ncbi:glycosyltransferase [uncultured Bacteroides sp.]|uniref:glycosyltransferase n=1 Tax=uncultured Bacteroides sp. TaxID=162156 RepID=UPI00259B8F38|nr:glycosyltransferase [uncultured Bacteroides sp.]